MSMIYELCDRLQDGAKELRDLAPDPDVPYLVPSTKETMALAMGSAASEMCRAADIILELRCKLSGAVDQSEEVERLKSENAKLRAECDEWHRVAASKQDIIDHMRDARAENAKLRELIQKTWKWAKNGCYKCPLEKDCKVLCVYDGDCGIAVEIEKWLQELGIEADE